MDLGEISDIQDLVMNNVEKKDIGIQHNFIEADSGNSLNIFVSNLFITPTSCDAETQACIPTAVKTKQLPKGFHGFNSVNNKQGLLDLTGTNYESFQLLLKFLSKNIVEESEKRIKINVENRLFVFLLKMKCDLTFSAISVLFEVIEKQSQEYFMKF